MAEGGGDGGGCGIGDGAFTDAEAGDAQFAESAPFDLETQAHERHQPPAHITFDFTPPSDVPLEAAVVSEPSTWSLHNTETRASKVSFWRRLGRAILALHGG